MALNPFFLQGSSSEQRLVQELINEQLKIYGVEVTYIPRKFVRKQTIIEEIQSSTFDADSPYNTYKYTSLPPTPISGFGEKSMEAIFNTPENQFIYYLLTDINGKMTFTDNYEEFINLKNKAKDEGVIP